MLVPAAARGAPPDDGAFVTTDVDLVDGVTLFVDDGAELAVCANHTSRALVSVRNASGAVIAGGGTLHGRAELTIGAPESAFPRPPTPILHVPDPAHECPRASIHARLILCSRLLC